MDWTKLNMKEVTYFCKSHGKSYDIDFDNLTFSLQIDCLLMLFYYYKIDTFTIKDIQEFYKKMEIPKWTSDGIIKPSPSKIRKALSYNFFNIEKNIQSISDDCYKIIFIDTNLYEDDIKKGYQYNKIV